MQFPTPPRFVHGHNARKPPRPDIPGPRCACGCGQLAKYGNQYVNGHNGRGLTRPAHVVEAIRRAQTGRERPEFRGELAPNYRGFTVHRSGYIQQFVPDHPYAVGSGYVMQHRLVVENDLLAHQPDSEWLTEVAGRKVLRRDLEVHHIDGDKANNDRANLLVLTKRDHALLHQEQIRQQG